MLRKRYFGGGTVLAAVADSPFRRFRPETERRLTDGTEHFLGVLSLEVRLIGPFFGTEFQILYVKSRWSSTRVEPTIIF